MSSNRGIPENPPRGNTLAPLSAFAAQSFDSSEALFQAVLNLLTEQLGMRTSFLTEILPADNHNHIRAAHNLVGGCGLEAGITLPLNETFCSIITNSNPPAPLVIGDIRYDAVFGDHPAAVASPHIGCFVGVPLVLRDGSVFGTLCAIDPEPRHITPLQTDLLIVLARFVATQLDHDRDEIARSQLEAERDQLLQTAQEALRERDALVAIASHELKNPLAALLGHAQLLQRHMSEAEAITDRDRKRLAIIITQAQRLNIMLSELLDVSQLDSGQLPLVQMPLDIGMLVQHVLNEMFTLYADHALQFVKPNQPLLVNADSFRMEQVIRNLLSNAIKYTPSGGTITITVERKADDAVVSVADTGIGMSGDAIPNLFRRFYRARRPRDNPVAGFGIGLYVVREIIMRHGGMVSVTSAEGEGSTFTVRLPLLITSA